MAHQQQQQLHHHHQFSGVAFPPAVPLSQQHSQQQLQQEPNSQGYLSPSSGSPAYHVKTSPGPIAAHDSPEGFHGSVPNVPRATSTASPRASNGSTPGQQPLTPGFLPANHHGFKAVSGTDSLQSSASSFSKNTHKSPTNEGGGPTSDPASTSAANETTVNRRKRQISATTTGSNTSTSTAPRSGTSSSKTAKGERKGAAPTPASSASTTTTTSGRGVANLTPEQLAKKRANDRDAQRAIRERTKNQIETLERRIEELTSQDSYRELQEVVRQKEAVEAENEEIKKRLAEVLRILTPLLSPGQRNELLTPFDTELRDLHNSQNGSASYKQPPRSSVSTHFLQSHITRSVSPNQSMPNTPSSQTWHQDGALGSTPRSILNGPSAPSFNNRGYDSYQASDRKRSQDSEMAGYSPYGMDPRSGSRRSGPALPADSHITLGTTENHQPPAQRQFLPRPGSILPNPHQHPQSSPRNLGPPETAFGSALLNVPPTCLLDGVLHDFLAERKQLIYNNNIPETEVIGPPYPNFTALIHPDQVVNSHPLSRVFHDILKTFPDLARLAEQVAILYHMFATMRWQIAPTQANYQHLPDWIKPLECQFTIPHPAWIDHVPWPAMRDEMVRTWRQYPFDNFFIPYTTTVSLNWMSSGSEHPHDVLVPLERGSEEFVMSAEFERHMLDLDNWSLGEAFRKAYPVLGKLCRIR
ncbi:hypothetical protein MMC25_000375 [Agyrium rufum]|nr:hypothetical protein [Agyrium rufum]